MGWQPIETAPVGVPVRYGYWEAGFREGDLIWRQEIGVLLVRTLILRRIVRSNSYRADKATHWMPYPDPPEPPQ